MLPETAVSLLPNADEAPRCAPFNRELAVDPAGTAISATLLLLVETPLPWPKPVFEHPMLDGFASVMTTAAGPTKVLAAVPSPDNPCDGARITAYWPTAEGTMGATVDLDSVEALGALRRRLEIEQPATVFADHAAPAAPAMLVCTQGSHDVCCGTEGTRLANAAVERHPSLRVFRVSHTGGHRFSPTAMTMPEGRMWAHLDDADVDAILERGSLASAAAVASKCRGWWGAAMGPEQVAERALFERLGWDIDTSEREFIVAEADEHDGTQVDVRVGDRRWRAVVEVGRIVPTISCRAVGGLPAKPGREYRVRSLLEG